MEEEEEEVEVEKDDKRLRYDSMSRCCEESPRRVGRTRARRSICYNRLSISRCFDKDASEEISNIATSKVRIPVQRFQILLL